MRYLLILLLLSFGLVARESARAQHVSDPNAIDMTPFLFRIDTNGLRTVALPINIGALGGDTSQDLLLEQDRYDTNGDLPFVHAVATMSGFGAASLTPVGIDGIARLAGNFDGEGALGIVTMRIDSSGAKTRIDWPVIAPQFFDTAESTPLIDPSASNAAPMLVGDYNRDGIQDLFLISNSRAYLFDGAEGWRGAKSVLPSDSAALGSSAYPYWVGQALGFFDRSEYPSLCIASSGWASISSRTAYFRVQYYPNESSTGGKLWQTTPVDLFLDTIANSDMFVYSAPVLAYDITGDGIDDLLICDSAHIYVFKGGPSFVKRTLTKSEADFVITSPALLDPAHYGRTTFATSIFAAGDLTGTGVPYLGVSGMTESGSTLIPVTWLYAGGTALDTYYDGTIYYTHSGGTTVARRTGQTSRDGLAVLRSIDTTNECDLLSQGTEKLPHQFFASVSAPEKLDQISVIYLPNHLVEVHLPGMTSDASIQTTNLLGQQMSANVHRSVSSPGFTLDMTALPSGVYFAIVRDHGKRWSVKLIR